MPHKVEIPDYVIERVMQKRGKLEVFDSFEADKTALVVIDMQNFFVEEVDAAISIVPNINRLAETFRERGGLVVWVVLTVAPSAEGPSDWPIYHDYFFTEQKRAAHIGGLASGTHGNELYKDMDVQEGDLIVEKNRFSAFIQGASDLDQILKDRGIENLVVTGTATNMCCESSARDAMMLGYRAMMVFDANAARYDDDHLAGLTSFWQSFGDVRTTDDIIENVLKPAAGAAAAE